MTGAWSRTSLVAIALCASTAQAAEAPAKPEAAKQEPPPAWLPPTPPTDTPRLQQKLHVKLKHFQADIAGQYLWRADFFYNPALGLTLRYYALENVAAELAGTRFFSSMQANAQEVRDKFGYVPDSHEPQWLLRGGARGSVGYGKLLFGQKIIHIEPQVAGHVNWLIQDGTSSFGFDVSAGFLFHWTSYLHTTFELVIFPHMENRSGWKLVTGVMPSLSIGFGWPP